MELKGKPKLTQIDPFVNRVFEGTVAPGFPAEEFSARWTGQITVPESGEYQFVVSGDDGYRLFVNEEMIISKWMDQGETLTRKVLKLEQ